MFSLVHSHPSPPNAIPFPILTTQLLYLMCMCMCSHTQEEEALNTACKRWRIAIRRVIRIQHVRRITEQLQSLRITWPGMETGSTTRSGRKMATCTISGDDGDEDDTADKGRVELVTLPSFLNVSPSLHHAWKSQTSLSHHLIFYRCQLLVVVVR